MNRVIKDSIWSSPSLALLDMLDQLHWPRWLLLGDDWGCFESDTDVIKGLVYPKLDEVDKAEIDRLKDVYFYSGKIFFWWHEDREYGFFVSHINHQFCNATSVDATTGRQVRHRRRTPEPPSHLIKRYMNCFRKINQVDIEKLDRLRTLKNKYRNHNPNLIPKPNPKPKHPAGKSDLKGEEQGDKEEKKIRKIYNNAKRIKPALDDRIIKAWKEYHEKYPKMGWDKLLKERGIKI